MPEEHEEDELEELEDEDGFPVKPSYEEWFERYGDQERDWEKL